MVPIADHAAPILVTRSEPGATALIGALRASGYAALRFPVLQIRALDSPRIREVLARLDRFDVAIFVSGHAVRLGLPLIEAIWHERPRLLWIAVGRTTASALGEHGILTLTPEPETSEGILAMAQLRDVVGRRVLICAGRGGRSLLADALTRRGAAVERCELYVREPVSIDSAAASMPVDGAVGAVVISSVDGARAFAAVWRGVGGDERVTLIVPSQRVADALTELEFQRVVVAEGPGARAVVAAIGSLGSQAGEDHHEG